MIRRKAQAFSGGMGGEPGIVSIAPSAPAAPVAEHARTRPRLTADQHLLILVPLLNADQTRFAVQGKGGR